MPLQKNLPIDEIKLDSVLSLILHAQEERRNGLGFFHNQYGDLFSGELNRLEWQLFEDGLIRYSVGTGGLIIEITEEGFAFFCSGGYGGGGLHIKPQTKNTAFKRSGRRLWNWLIISGFATCIVIVFILKLKKG